MDHGGGQLVNLRQLLENLRIGRVAALRFLPMRKFEHLEQNMPELLGRIDVELLACQLVDAGLEPVDLRLGGRADFRKLPVEGRSPANNGVAVLYCFKPDDFKASSMIDSGRGIDLSSSTENTILSLCHV